MATTNSRDWIFTHAFSESSFKTYEKNGLARRDTNNLLDPAEAARILTVPGVPTRGVPSQSSLR
jgi:hypothetical protein